MVTENEEGGLKVELEESRFTYDYLNKRANPKGHDLRVSGTGYGGLSISFRRTIRVVSQHL